MKTEKNIWTERTHIDRTQDICLGEEPIEESFTNDIGMLFRSCRKQYGKCVSKMYRDEPDGRAIQVGWVFQKKEHYFSTKGTYIRETWVELFERDHEIVKHNLKLI